MRGWASACTPARSCTSSSPSWYTGHGISSSRLTTADSIKQANQWVRVRLRCVALVMPGSGNVQAKVSVRPRGRWFCCAAILGTGRGLLLAQSNTFLYNGYWPGLGYVARYCRSQRPTLRLVAGKRKRERWFTAPGRNRTLELLGAGSILTRIYSLFKFTLDSSCFCQPRPLDLRPA